MKATYERQLAVYQKKSFRTLLLLPFEGFAW